MERISFIGGGIMAEAMIQGLLKKQLIPAKSIVVSGPREHRREELKARYRIQATADNGEAAGLGKIVVISVEPKMMARVLADLKGNIRPDALILSIAAGCRIATIADGLSHAAIVRAMPNTPAQIGHGLTVWMATEHVATGQRKQAKAIFQALGREVSVEDEKYLDMATAVSGTGPTYIFMVLEALIDAAVHLGFPRHLANELVIETMQGAILFAKQSEKHPAELRNMVTSPGGTSAEAIYQMEKGTLRTVLSKAVWAAYQKTCLLGESVGKSEPSRLLNGSNS